jgi:hypothetical protein
MDDRQEKHCLVLSVDRFDALTDVTTDMVITNEETFGPLYRLKTDAWARCFSEA